MHLHLIYGGQRQGGISTPLKEPLIFLFTGDKGSKYGYRDEFRSDGIFLYTGEGQEGDMRLIRGNASIARHKEDGKLLLLFEDAGKGMVRFIGEVDYIGYHTETRVDRVQGLRAAIIFHLSIRIPVFNEISLEMKETNSMSRSKDKMELLMLREQAMARSNDDTGTVEKVMSVRARALAIRRYALKRAKGTCQGCKQRAPFRVKARNGWFLEVHHLLRLADGGPDHPRNVIALCPNCHRRSHYSVDAEMFNAELIKWVKQYEDRL